MKKEPHPYLPLPGEMVHFRKRAIQSELNRSTGTFSEQLKTQTVVEAVGEVKGILGDGRITLKMLSWQDDCGTWVKTRVGVVMNVHIDDIDL